MSKEAGPRFTVVASPIGRLLVAATDSGLWAVVPGDDEAALEAALREAAGAAEPVRDDAAMAGLAADLLAGFEDEAVLSRLPLDAAGTEFQQAVWAEVRTIARGSTRTSAEIAAALGKPRAAGAVGQACAASPFAVVVPTHRVCAADGTPLPWPWGAALREALVAHESMPGDESLGEVEEPAFVPPPPPPERDFPDPRSLKVGALLTALVALGQISTSVYVPSLPALGRTLHAPAFQVNLTLSLFLVAFGVSQLIYGPLSDRFGRRPVLLGGLGVYMLASLWCAMSLTIDQLIVARFVQAVGACAGPVVGRAIVRDLHAGEHAARVMAYIGLALAVSPAVSPIIGGYLQVWFGWRASFVFLVGVGMVVTASVWWLLAETNEMPDPEAADPASLIRSYRTLLGDAAYLGHALAAAFSFAGLMAYTAGAPFVIISLFGLGPEEFGMLAVFNVAGFSIGSWLTARHGARLGLDRLIRTGLAACLAGGAAMVGAALAGWAAVPAVIGPMAVFMAGMGMILPAAMAGALSPFPRMAGAASALLGFIQMVVSGLIAAALGAVAATDQGPMALAILACAAAAFAAYRLSRRPPSMGGSTTTSAPS